MSDHQNPPTHSSSGAADAQPQQQQHTNEGQQPPIRMANLERIAAEKNKITAKYAQNAKNFQKNTGYELDFSKHGGNAAGEGDQGSKEQKE